MRIGCVEVKPEEDTVWDREMGRFLLEFLVDRASFVISRMVATIIRALRSVTAVWSDHLCI
jgi:hypothetical protein